jgi:hypothetical protein
MQPKILLRIAFLLVFLHNLGHTIAHIGWKSATAPVQQTVIQTMLSHSFVFMGRTGSYARFFEGYGYAGTLALLLVMVMLWLCAADLTTLSKKLVLLLAIFMTCWAVMEWIYFFPMAAIMSFISALFCAVAYSRWPEPGK